MATSTSAYYTIGTPPVYENSDTDPIEPTTQIYALVAAFELHDHSTGRGKAIPPAGLSGDVLKRTWYFAQVGD